MIHLNKGALLFQSEVLKVASLFIYLVLDQWSVFNGHRFFCWPNGHALINANFRWSICHLAVNYLIRSAYIRVRSRISAKLAFKSRLVNFVSFYSLVCWMLFSVCVCKTGFNLPGVSVRSVFVHVIVTLCQKKEDKFNKKLGVYDECVIFCTTVDVFNVWGSIQNWFDLVHGTFYICRWTDLNCLDNCGVCSVIT